MGVPKRLTEMQQKFANLLVSNEGRKTAYECAIEAGYEKDRARITASELQNPKKYPLVVKHIGEIREEYQKKYEVTYERHISELGKITRSSTKERCFFCS
jgi:phage terminase small subunit